MIPNFGLLAEYIKDPKDFKVIEEIEKNIFLVEEEKKSWKTICKKSFRT